MVLLRPAISTLRALLPSHVGKAQPKLGAHLDASGRLLRVRVYSKHASKLTVEFFPKAMGADAALRVPLIRNPATNVWEAEVSVEKLRAHGVKGPILYGYRAWGPNWRPHPDWKPGSEKGFVADVDSEGNRFNPNKLLLDPYALELTHDPVNPKNRDGALFASGEGNRHRDSARFAPKGVVLRPAEKATGAKPTFPIKDAVIYEVHVKNLTANDPSVPENLRGTYAGAAKKAEYLKSLGVNTVEFLPVQEAPNDQNDIDPTSTEGNNHWGYMTQNFFAPDRRYSSDKTPGGPTREFQAMVKAFHDAGIKVYIDVVYNHTAESGIWSGNDPSKADLLSFRGLDNQTYYEKAKDPRWYYDSTGCGANFNCANETVRDLIIDSLKHWKDVLGVDGFRFDLAPVLGNEIEQDGFTYDRTSRKSPLKRAVRELGIRSSRGGPGVDLIAEAWDAGGHYLVGQFPRGWSEWNGKYRDTVRRIQNAPDDDKPTPGELATRIAGSSDLYATSERKPWNSINFLVCHDGFTLADLYRFDQKQNWGAWPFGPSDGGEDHNISWDQGGDPAAQRQAARTGMALLFLSAGVPMITGGDEFLRTQHGNNNAYNLDSDKNWLDYKQIETNQAFHAFTKRLIAFRHAHPALRPPEFFTGKARRFRAEKDITWLTASGNEADGLYMDDPSNRFLAYRIDGTSVAGESARSLMVAYNADAQNVELTLPTPAKGHRWYRVADTAAWMEDGSNFRAEGEEDPIDSSVYGMKSRSVTLFIEKPSEPKR